MVKKLFKRTFLTILRVLAKIELLKHKNAKIIGITGSSGKTTCKETVVAFLKPHYKERLKYTKKGNSESGIPFEILNIPIRHYKIWEYPFVLLRGIFTIIFNFNPYDVFVIEYGIDAPTAPQNMEYLLSIVRPDVAILLSISAVHGERFETAIDESIPASKRVAAVEKAIAKEKFKLLTAVSDRSAAFLTAQVASYLSPDEYKDMVLLDEVKDPHIVAWENTLQGITFSMLSGRSEIETTIPGIAFADSSKMNILFAAVITKYLKKDIRISLTKLAENYHIAAGRSSLLAGVKGATIIDSSYNANPYAAKELFPLVKELARKGRREKVIVLGDFRELGKNAPTLYHEVVKEAAKYADTLVFTNNLMKEYGIPTAEQAGFVLNKNLYWFQNGKQLSFHIVELIEKNAVVLFEGSQNTVFLEYAVKELCANKDPHYLRTHLPRMSADWLGIK